VGGVGDFEEAAELVCAAVVGVARSGPGAFGSQAIERRSDAARSGVRARMAELACGWVCRG
jgi:hypothetical protein